MKECPRAFQATLQRSLREFPVTTVVGLRQVGKTTVVRRVADGWAYVTLDDLGALSAARRDPQGWLAALPRPVAIDEVQRVPELLLPIKREVDRRRKSGQFLLTGSARIELRRGVQETLAGRASLLRLRPMTWAEAAARAEWNPLDRLFRCRSAAEAMARFGPGAALDARDILAGGLPEPMLQRRGASRARWFDQYHRSYVERDVPAVLQVEEVPSFVRFASLAAARTSQVTNFAALARDAGVSADTGLRWFGVLEATFLADLVPPWWRNIGKRLTKSPKLHLGDAGLAAHLMGVRSWDEALRLNLGGALLETLVAQHLLAYAETASAPTAVHHYRTHAGAEVDFVLSRGARLIPVEVKLSATPRPSDASGLRSFLTDFSPAARFGVVLHAGTDTLPLGRALVALPLHGFLAGA